MATIAACARNLPVGSVSVPPIPPGEARVWFYRVYLPSDTLNMTKVTMNRVYTGYVQLGGAFYLDVPPGIYHVEVESYGKDFDRVDKCRSRSRAGCLCQNRIPGQLVDFSRRRIRGRPRHILRAADAASDRALRNHPKLLRRRQLTASLSDVRHRRRCGGTCLHRRLAVSYPGRSGAAEGLDCSPKGDKPGFVQVEDDGHTLLIPDRRGNNRIDSIKNVVEDPRVALIFLVPGANETYRVNGRARVSVDPVLKQRFAVDGKEPTTVIVVGGRAGLPTLP